MLSKFLLSYFICKYVLKAADLDIPRNEILIWHLSGGTTGA